MYLDFLEITGLHRSTVVKLGEKSLLRKIFLTGSGCSLTGSQRFTNESCSFESIKSLCPGFESIEAILGYKKRGVIIVETFRKEYFHGQTVCVAVGASSERFLIT